MPPLGSEGFWLNALPDWACKPSYGGAVVLGLITLACVVAVTRAMWRCLEARRGSPTAGPRRRLRIIYASQKGTARGFAHRIFTAVSRWRSQSPAHAAYLAPPVLASAADVEAESLQHDDLVVLVLATYTGGGAPERCEQFRADLCDIATDFRYGGAFLARQTTFVLGLGDVAYAANYNRFAKDTCDWLRSLGARRVSERLASEKKAQPLVVHFIGDVVSHLDNLFADRVPQPAADDDDAASTSKKTAAKGEDGAAAVPLETESDDDDDDGSADGSVDDLEDIAGIDAGAEGGRGELLYPRLRQSLTKQGYRLIGSHSGVKLCRWTKAMLRGRGGCYKHTFYNISSYQCMEMTPSLACANKCVFCWRHHTNPVGKEFTWQVDSPEFLVEGAIAAHQGMLKPMKGVPGVTPDKLAEAMNVKHCALSLVGEPIMYPRINEFVELLHAKHISTFMVTNAQFPDRIAALSPVTQHYLSLDAPTKEELKAIDRPLFDDFWERTIASIKALRAKTQRTVFRLTLVEGYNMTGLEDYCRLIELGAPDFIEVKGVTYCGNSDASPITMRHVPFHHEVVKFCDALAKALERRRDERAAREAAAPAAKPAKVRGVIGGDDVPGQHTAAASSAAQEAGLPPCDAPLASTRNSNGYGIACEHEHSCCVLLADHRFRRGGAWHTWIDYARFFELFESGRRDFDALEYSAPTPGWAVFRSDERGFDPAQTRHYRKKRAVPGGGC